MFSKVFKVLRGILWGVRLRYEIVVLVAQLLPAPGPIGGPQMPFRIIVGRQQGISSGWRVFSFLRVVKPHVPIQGLPNRDKAVDIAMLQSRTASAASGTEILTNGGARR